jgi:hypothetical protein
MTLGEILKVIADSTTSKNVMLSAIVGVGGFAIHQAMVWSDVQKDVAWHSAAIKELKANSDLTQKAITDHTVTLSRIDGKLDVINQKIDDDRNYAQRHQPVNSR